MATLGLVLLTINLLLVGIFASLGVWPSVAFALMGAACGGLLWAISRR